MSEDPNEAKARVVREQLKQIRDTVFDDATPAKRRVILAWEIALDCAQRGMAALRGVYPADQDAISDHGEFAMALERFTASAATLDRMTEEMYGSDYVFKRDEL